MGIFKVYAFGIQGVNIDSDPISLQDQELRLAQNTISDVLGEDSGVRKRPGLNQFNTEDTGGIILGGISVSITSAGGGGGSGHTPIILLMIGRSTT